MRAKMVLDAGEYRWSSYRANALGERFDWLVEHDLYRSLGRTKEARQMAYRAICGVPLTDEELLLQRNPPPLAHPIAGAAGADNLESRVL